MPRLRSNQREISDSRAYYPAVGLLLGLLLVGVDIGARELFPVHLTAALLLAVLVVATRALHLDGFMDMCDGLFGGYTKERRLEIMKDTNVGAFAVAGA
ncbi:MAG: adenosylcobinamide-GDP ribazoletransferase, partial [Chloroflexi bacterium]|nr:adenosylcobinamide-GDP ribazoletransferase [Chloroflexota bacterium]